MPRLKATPLTAEEKKTLARLERGIIASQKALITAGFHLRLIWVYRLYRGTHPDFETYCRERLEMGRRRVTSMINAACIMEALKGHERFAKHLTWALPTSVGMAHALAIPYSGSMNSLAGDSKVYCDNGVIRPEVAESVFGVFWGIIDSKGKMTTPAIKDYVTIRDGVKSDRKVSSPRLGINRDSSPGEAVAVVNQILDLPIVFSVQEGESPEEVAERMVRDLEWAWIEGLISSLFRISRHGRIKSPQEEAQPMAIVA